MITTGEVFAITDVQGMEVKFKCNACGHHDVLRNIWCGQPNDPAECFECHSTDVESAA